MAALATTPTTKDAAATLFFREKGFWTFGRGQRLSDLRRLVRQYGRTQDQAFPAGSFSFKIPGAVYGCGCQLPRDRQRADEPKLQGLHGSQSVKRTAEQGERARGERREPLPSSRFGVSGEEIRRDGLRREVEAGDERRNCQRSLMRLHCFHVEDDRNPRAQGTPEQSVARRCVRGRIPRHRPRASRCGASPAGYDALRPLATGARVGASRGRGSSPRGGAPRVAYRVSPVRARKGLAQQLIDEERGE